MSVTLIVLGVALLLFAWLPTLVLYVLLYLAPVIVFSAVFGAMRDL